MSNMFSLRNARAAVMYAAGFFLFVVGPLLVGGYMWAKEFNTAKEVFFHILPVATAIASYWIAHSSRGEVGNEHHQPSNAIRSNEE